MGGFACQKMPIVNSALLSPSDDVLLRGFIVDAKSVLGGGHVNKINQIYLLTTNVTHCN